MAKFEIAVIAPDELAQIYTGILFVFSSVLLLTFCLMFSVEHCLKTVVFLCSKIINNIHTVVFTTHYLD